MGLPAILLTVTIFTMCSMCRSDEIMTVMEGKYVQLLFPYQCDSTRITLQLGSNVPFYTLTDPGVISQDNRFHFMNLNESNICLLHFAIDPVIRSDAGTYICVSYSDSGTKAIERVGLDVDFPPGKVTCKPGDEHTVGKWVALSCKAPVGRLRGQIGCYQNGERMPPLTAPIESDWYLKQTILVKKNAYLIFCCSSPLEQTKDRCECNDFKMDLTNDKIESKMIDPCGSDKMKTVMEGDHVQFDFPYPCESTIVTLQSGLKIPFYTFTDSEIISLPFDQEKRFQVKNSKESNNCTLHFAIDPVVRSDAGTYICVSCSDGGMRVAIERVGLDVDFPPGKVTCTLGDEHTVAEWVALSCKAAVGRLWGEVDCYQNGERMPPLTVPIESDWYLKQTILVQNNAYPIFCCSSFFEHTKDRCECNDFYMDLTNGKIESKMIDPCGSSTPGHIQIETSEIVNSACTCTSNPIHVTETVTNISNNNSSVSWENVVIGSFGAIITAILSILAIQCFRSKRNFEIKSQRTPDKKSQNETVFKL